MMAIDSTEAGYLVPSANTVVEGDALDDVFQQMLVGLTGLPGDRVRPRWQRNPAKMPEISTDWVAVGVVDENEEHGAAVVTFDAATGSKVRRHEDVSVLATFYGPNSKGYARQVRDALQLPQNRELLQSSYISFVDAGTIRAVPEQFNEQWVKRADLTLRFRRVIERTFAVKSFASADLDVKGGTLIHVQGS
jgi:hypothetical protein